MIRIRVNGEERQVPAGTTLGDLVAEVAGKARGTAVAVNAEVVPRGAWGPTALREGDRVEILRAAQGGC